MDSGAKAQKIHGMVQQHEVACKADDAIRYSKNILTDNFNWIRPIMDAETKEKCIQLLSLLSEIQLAVHYKKCDIADELKEEMKQ